MLTESYMEHEVVTKGVAEGIEKKQVPVSHWNELSCQPFHSLPALVVIQGGLGLAFSMDSENRKPSKASRPRSRCSVICVQKSIYIHKTVL